MANRRMLSKSISTSLRVNRISEFAQLLFTWIIPHTDDFGRIDGEPEVIKALVMPFSKRKVQDFIKALIEMSQVGLIQWYRTEGKAVIEIVNSDLHQSNLISKRTKSYFPGFGEKSELFQEILGSSGSIQEIRPYIELNLTKPNLTKPNSLLLTQSERGKSDLKKLTQTEKLDEQTVEASAEVTGRAKTPSQGVSKLRLGDSFALFWANYPKRVSKGQARRAWEKLNPTEQLQGHILASLELAKTSDQWAKDNGRFIPHPATWLNAEGWEDEITQAKNGLKSWLQNKLREEEGPTSEHG